MRITNGMETNQRRGTIVSVVFSALIYLALASSFTSAVGETVSAVVCAGIAAFFVRSYLKTKRLQGQTWVQINGSTLEWSTAPQANAIFTRAGTLELRDAAAITVLPSPFELKAGPKKMLVTPFAFHITLKDGRNVVLPITSTKLRVSVSMQQLIAALAAVPEIVPVDASALDGTAPAPYAGKVQA